MCGVHRPLPLLKVQHPSGKLARWSQTLSEFELELHYRPGRVNSNADALSRAPVGESDPESDSEVQISHVSATIDTLPELGKLQRDDAMIGQVMRFVVEGIMPYDK